MSAQLAAYVTEYFRRLRAPVLGQITDATDLAVSPDERRVAFTAWVSHAIEADPQREVAVLDLELLTVHRTEPAHAETYQPCWSPDGDRLAWIVDRGDATSVAIATATDLPGGRTVDVPGFAEYVRWSPGGTSLLVGVAEAGAARSDVYGSGRLPAGEATVSWAPLVARGEPSTGARRAWLVGVSAGTSTCVPTKATVWSAAWAGGDSLLAVISDRPGESDWYGARLALIDAVSGSETVLLDPPTQLAQPAAAPSGQRLSAVVGAMSDRGLDVGELLVFDGPGTPPRTVDTAGVDVTDHRWLDDDRLVFAGLRGLETVVGSYDAGAAATRIIWQSAQSCGDLLPRVAASAGTVAVTVHGYGHPPAIARIVDGGLDMCLELGPSAVRPPGRIEPVQWPAADGRTIHGLLAAPEDSQPHPLVVHVHGGPVWAWRDAWSLGAPYTQLLVEHGYAVLHANARGSAGHGQDFIRAGLHDMGGADAADLLAGVAALGAAGQIDPTRVGIMGNSYGGFMAAWLAATSDRFGAAVARSPVTDWVSQHHASNLPGFDRSCLRGDPLDPESDYHTRSPLYLAEHIRTPMLLMAGANDLATPPEQAAMLHRALVERNRHSTLVIYPEEGHGVRHHPALVDQCTRILAFFDAHLAPDAPGRLAR